MKKNQDIEKLSPMLKQYREIKSANQDSIIFFRLGDFYEMFEDDAILASKELQLFLTKKACGDGSFIPMCGVPHHAYMTYAQKLIDNGHKVAICEQLEDPKKTKKLVKRDIVRLITPGANLDINGFDSNYMASIVTSNFQALIAYCDISTGDIYTTATESTKEKILEKLLALEIKELVCQTDIDENIILYIKNNSNICISYHNNSNVDLEVSSLCQNIFDERKIKAVAILFNYIKNIEKQDISYFKKVEDVLSQKLMRLDFSAIKDMELIKTLDNKTYGSLYWVLNKTSTPMGNRLLKQKILNPLSNIDEVNNYLSITNVFVDNFIIRDKLRDILSQIYDIERLISKIQYETCNGHDLLLLKKSLKVLPTLKEELYKINSPLINELFIKKIDDLSGVYSLLEKAISEDCPILASQEGMFKPGYDSQLDELINLTLDSKKWIQDLENKEKEKTQIKSLKIGYNNVFGYYIEVSQSQIPLIKDEWGYIRKQTTKNSERYITLELKEHEDKILHSKELRIEREKLLFKQLRVTLSTYTKKIQSISDTIALLDYFLTLAFISSENNYVKPIFNTNNTIEIRDSRHPIIEKANPQSIFVENDYSMDNNTSILLITGPNMGGKSTYMKQFGLIVIMAQIGCYVPASYCNIPIFSSIYTRIGASDNLIKGRSTFMTEMSEVAQALSLADSHSLFLFDEIGRGTATHDGMAIAQAIIEYIAKNLNCKTLFSTHYHEITQLSSSIKTIKNIHCEVSEENGSITFLYKMKEGSMDKSYGINVAKLANLPDEVTSRAFDILESLENNFSIPKETIKEVKKEKIDPLKVELSNINPMEMSPIQALNYLIELKKKI